MVRKSTPWMVALALAASLGLACTGRLEDVDDVAELSAPTEETVAGREGDDPGYAEAILQAAPEDDPTTMDSTSTGSDGDLGQHSDALLSTRGASLASEARRIADFVNRSTSYYTHTTYMNESTGTRRSDCSGLIAYILSRKSPSGLALVPTNEVRPVARDYYEYLAQRPTTASTISTARWRRILHPINLKSGDLVVYKYSSGSTTGHVMMVASTPRVGRYREVLVDVVDSAMSGHASDDRRTQYTGPGRGTIGIAVDGEGRPVGYYWRGGLSTTLNETSIVMGRLE
jgi:hypothetical protein